jgi:formylglycine-generating enzyme required for sulfatase activity
MRKSAAFLALMTVVAVACWTAAAAEPAAPAGSPLTLKGSMVCNGACIPNPKADDHVMVLYAIDGTLEVRAEVGKIMKEFYPDKMMAADKPFAMPDKEPFVLKINDNLTLKCVCIPPGKFLMGTPLYMWPYFMEEYPHMVSLTKSFYLSEVPVTQEVYEAVMGSNPSTAMDPRLPVQDPTFADLRKFCQALSEKTGRKVRLPTDAEWEYAARVVVEAETAATNPAK